MHRTVRFFFWTTLMTTTTVNAADIPANWLNFGGKPNDVQWKANWIWTDGPASPRNFYLCARKDFDLPQDATELRLHISADSRYRLYINGEWVGDGPARSFYWAQQFDTYDTAGLLKPGRNTIAVLVSHYGEGTFQYNPSGQAGLLVQLETRNEPWGLSPRFPSNTEAREKADNWKPILTTDDTWQVQPHEGYLRPTMRISCQMPFEEIVDARRMPADWMSPAGKLPQAKPAKVIGSVGSGPWKTLVGRTVPFLTREPITPVRMWKAQLVKMPDLHTGFTTRPYLLPGYFMQSHKELNGFAATIIESPVDQAITFPKTCGRAELPVVNGQVAEDNKPVALHKGANLVVIPIRPGGHHEYDRSYCAFIEKDPAVKLTGVFNTDTAWTIFGPFENYGEVHGKISKAASLADLEPYKAKARIVRPEHILTNGSAWEESTVARPVEGEPKIANVEGLFSSQAEVTTIYPSDDGNVKRAAGFIPALPSDNKGRPAGAIAPELWLDFGRELVGQIELDIDAPAGATLTFNFLEEIEDGKRVHYTGDNYAGFRYISAGGRQQFTSFLRRGYRYMKVIVTDATGPVHLRSLQAIFSTHPANESGAFACSDPLLTRIWQVGRHTLRCCSEDTYTDCPAYEQTYWVGDGRNEAMVDYAAYGNLALSRRCSELPAVSLQRQLLTESQVPSAWDNILTGWSLLWVMMTEEHYQYSGDREYLAGIYPAVDRMLRNVRQHHTDERGLLSIAAWNLFDWAGQDIGHALVTHNQMFLAEAIRRAEIMATELNKPEDAKYWKAYRDELVTNINKYLWSEEKDAYVDSIHGDGKLSNVVSSQTNSLALLYDVAPADRAARIKNAPNDPPEGMVRVGSPFALFYMLEALVHNGRHEDAIKIVRERWGEMVKHGATSFWETFPGRDGEFWTRSYCHAWSAAPTYFLSRYQLGAWWDQPGYKVARIAPIPLDLTWARGAVPTPHGPIQIAWEKANDKFTLELALPKAVSANVELPVPADEFSKLSPADLNAKKVNGHWQFTLPAGKTITIEATR